jgi:acyl-CoA synthetase (AMP-forming)/AMP-acid ligase II
MTVEGPATSDRDAPTTIRRAAGREIVRSTENIPSEAMPEAMPVDIASPELDTAGAVPGDAVAAIVYTAGSTGRPKGVVLRHRHFLAIARTLVQIVGMDAAHRDLILSPMTHSGGWQRVTSTLMAGGCVVIPGGTLTVPAILQSVVDHGVTAFFAAPPILRTILMSPSGKVAAALAGLRSIETASAPLSPDEVERLLALLPGTNLFVQYGLTECSRAMILDARDRPDKRRTVGTATPGVTVAIADESGRILGSGQEGEIVLRAEQCADRYWRQAVAGAERFRDGWLRTGDFGILDDEGYLTFLGRRDDMINCGGHSYFPKEVEAELGVPPGVKDILIAGVPDPQKILNHVPWAFVVPAREGEFSAQELLAWARARLPAHMVPRRVVVIPALPLTTTGKPSRRLAVERYGPAATAGAG